MRKRAIGFVFAAFMLVAFAPTALADSVSSTYKHHNVPAHSVLAAQAHAASGGQLPFTGTNLTIVAAVSIALLGLGFGLRRLSRKRG